jgi:hypothetical protein
MYTLGFNITSTPSSPKLAEIAGSFNKSLTFPDEVGEAIALGAAAEGITFPVTVSAQVSSGFSGSTYSDTVTITDDLTSLGVPATIKETLFSYDIANIVGGTLGAILAGLFGGLVSKFIPVLSETVGANITLTQTPDPVVASPVIPPPVVAAPVAPAESEPAAPASDEPDLPTDLVNDPPVAPAAVSAAWPPANEFGEPM